MGERKIEREKLKGKIDSGEVWKAFVDNLSRRVSRHELRDIFSSQGTVERVFIPKETRNPKYRFSTFAFVQFERESGLKRAIDMLNGSLIDGRRITVGVAKYTDVRPRK
ncbi:serine/arginine-rich splicing factor SC35-like [Hibiscus syriacus]|uniref:serine/arginine-rich splicing factor SC35-like n=1 Tax=Hibiscus syriacus TaxID=106335 RepID=UPI0019242249|nr:serine/arginine-rich splicing factor SC35-like [Hibiscus syriacus]